MLTEKIENIAELIEGGEDAVIKVAEVVEDIREEVNELYEEDQIGHDIKTEITELLDDLQTEYTHTRESSSIEPIIEELKEKVSDIE